MSQLNKKEKAFCRRYLETGNPERAASLSGIKKDPYELLTCTRIQNEIKRYGEAIEKTALHIARYALIRLAAGSVFDAAEMLSDKKDGNVSVSDTDLFSVSEIKRKGESIELRSFDKFKAIECLTRGLSEIESSVPFYDALIAGAQKLNQTENGD